MIPRVLVPVWGACVLAVVLAAGCGGSESGPDCDKLTNACAAEGATRCNASEDVVQTCRENEDGCLVWEDSRACGPSTRCANGACRCIEIGCDQRGATRCEGTAIETCVVDAWGCPDWEQTEDCAGSGQYCDDATGVAHCVEECTDQCRTKGATRCDGTVIETCAEADTGCLDWIAGIDCAANDELCDDSGDKAVCYTPCTDQCDTVDATWCNGTVIETCSMQADGCLDWEAGTDCADSDQACDDSGDDAVCYTPCTDECDTQDATRCNGTVIETCTMQDDGCTDWIAGTDCADTNQACEDDTGTATCVDVCSDECDTQDATRCNGTVIETCTMQDDGCTDWVAGTDCADNGDVCDEATGTAACVCIDACDTQDATRCNGTVIETCTMQDDGCTDWVAGTDCADTGEACDDATGSAACVCIDECTPEDSTRCNGTVIQTCTAGGDGCLDWVDGTDCAPLFCEDIDEPAACVECLELLADGSFEGGTPSDAWDEASTNFGSPLCNPALCNNVAGARSGSWWTWFGGCDSQCTYPEEGSVAQEVTLPAGETVTLFFFLAIPNEDGDATDTLEIAIDGTPVFTADGLDAASYETYTLVTGDLSAYADGDAHTFSVTGTSNNDYASFWVDDVSLGVGDTCCVDNCPEAGAVRCNGDLIETCAEGGDGCNDWILTTDCSAAGQECFEGGAEPACVTFSAASPGDNCDDASMVAVSIPADLPVRDTEQTTCGRGNDYADTCMGNYDDGEDIVYALDVTEATVVGFSVDPKDTAYTGIGLDTSCPPGAADCVFAGGVSSAGPYVTGCYALEPGSYHLMIDTYPPPDCIPDFDLIMHTCACATGDTRCADADTLATCSYYGTWEETSCDTGCGELAPGQFGCLPTELTVDGGWVAAEIAAGQTDAWFSFSGTEGTAYYVWWDDGYSGSGAYTLDLRVSAFQQDLATSYFEGVDSGYDTSQEVTIAAGEQTVYIQAMPYFADDTGTFAVAVTSTNTQP